MGRRDARGAPSCSARRHWPRTGPAGAPKINGPAAPATALAIAAATIGVEGADSYTAFGYANPTRRALAGVLHTRAEVREVMMEDNIGDDGSGPPDRVAVIAVVIALA